MLNYLLKMLIIAYLPSLGHTLEFNLSQSMMIIALYDHSLELFPQTQNIMIIE